MAVTVVEDTIVSLNLQISATGMSITRRFILEGIEVTNAGQFYELILNAELDVNVPAVGNAYPVNASSGVEPWFNLSCVSKSVRPLPGSTSKFEVICEYAERDATTLPPLLQNAVPIVLDGEAYAKKTVNSSLTTVQTNKLYGAQKVNSPSDPPLAADYFTTTETIDLFKQNEATASDNKPNQTALVDVQQPTVVIKYQRHEGVDPSSTTANHVHVGKTNSATFAGYAKGKLLLTNVSYEPVAVLDQGTPTGVPPGDQLDGKYTYIATYEFQVRTVAGNWLTELVYTEENNLPYAGATFSTPDNQTKVKYLTYEGHDFTAWNLE